jgi:hypothetical protein
LSVHSFFIIKHIFEWWLCYQLNPVFNSPSLRRYFLVKKIATLTWLQLIKLFSKRKYFCNWRVMMSAESSILLLNAAIIFIAYLSVYPKIAGKKINKVAALDCVASGLALMIVANKYWSSGIEFTFLFMQLNWFWYTLLSYSVIEIPIALWYFRDRLSGRE